MKPTACPAPADSVQARWVAALLDPDLPVPAGLGAPGGGPGVARRFAVHRHNVVSGLVDVLASSLPVTQTAVGETFFRAMAAVFVRQHPPCSPVLAGYGQALPDFLRGFPPAAGLPWLADLVRLELAGQAALHAADDTPLAAGTLHAALAQPDALPRLRLPLRSGAAVLRSDWAVPSFWRAHQAPEAPEEDPAAGLAARLAKLDMDQPEAALLLRVDDRLRLLPLGPGLTALLEACGQGQPLGRAAAQALAAEPALDLGRGLGDLLAHEVWADLLWENP
ncbi:HvfC/BufC N-terminal domain-containing protein [Ideonella livida]|uniref:DUF2063 domain-containing protein n=1 Tax=Ideonella livida TaxID=2707176 RepID=A0A7C9TIB9_9BURK|nr:DNA-binding domain-containing protein [Ideonella livida]NDY90324.1 DUF2063 domain-containing protein [Ideonella livida]